MDYRYLGNSGLKISEITYGNWLTHGSQVENDIATQCVRAALDAGISTFDTADVYANTKAETVLGEALKGERRESLEIFTKVYWPTGPGGKNDTGLSRKHILESINGSLTRLQTDYVDLYQAHRYDTETPLEETMQAFADVVRSGQGALHRRQRVDGRADPRRPRARPGPRHPAHLEPAAVLDAVAGHRGRGRARRARSSASARSSGARSPRACSTGKYQPGQAPPEGSRAADEKGGADMIKRFMNDDVLTRVQALKPVADEAGLHHGPARRRLGAPEPQRGAALVGASRPEQVGENVKAAGVTLEPELHGADRRRARRHRRA